MYDSLEAAEDFRDRQLHPDGHRPGTGVHRLDALLESVRYADYGVHVTSSRNVKAAFALEDLYVFVLDQRPNAHVVRAFPELYPIAPARPAASRFFAGNGQQSVSPALLAAFTGGDVDEERRSGQLHGSDSSRAATARAPLRRVKPTPLAL